jgi:hypothetical protein
MRIFVCMIMLSNIFLYYYFFLVNSLIALAPSVMGAYHHMSKHQSTQKKNTWASFLAFDLADYIMQRRDINLTLGACLRNRKRFQLKL